MNRIDLFLRNDGDRYYKNTEHEEERLKKFEELFNRAESAANRDPNRSPANLDKWRKAYLGPLGALIAIGVAGLVHPADIGLGLRDAAGQGHAVPHTDQIFSQQLPGHCQGVPVVKISCQLRQDHHLTPL